MADLPPPLLIAFVSDVSARTQFILPNADFIKSLPFDGIVVNIPASWSQMSPGVVISAADVHDWLDPLAGFNAGMHNYLALEIDDPGDLFDDAAWAQVARNWEVIGTVAAQTGFTGILFDNEEYQGRWSDYPEDYTDAESARGLAAYQAKASQRGRELAQVLARVMPQADLAVAHGPYVSVPANPALPFGIALQVGDADQHELAGPFFTGLLEGVGPDNTMTDAGEIYALRSGAEFQQSFDYRNSDLPGLIPWAVDPAVLADWSARVQQAHMIYTAEFPPGYGQTPDSFAATLAHAMAHSEGAVFVYTESEVFTWLDPASLPDDWRDALQQGVNMAAAARK